MLPGLDGGATGCLVEIGGGSVVVFLGWYLGGILILGSFFRGFGGSIVSLVGLYNSLSPTIL
ncbi:MAG: hypothetical protein QF535_02070 [Anaerolineales bacterium]|nr:hypothetical protein [Anaerolineales bacterium]